jgi:hypothetical protein
MREFSPKLRGFCAGNDGAWRHVPLDEVHVYSNSCKKLLTFREL